MNIYNNILSPFIGLVVLHINEEGIILDTVLDSKDFLKGKKPKTIYDIFGKEEKYRLNSVLALGGGQRKRFVQLNSKYAKGEYVDVAISWVGGKLYIYLQFFESERDREVEYDRYIEKLANLSERDPLTNVLNRQGFWTRIKRLLTYSDPDKRIGIIYLDIDNLKEINDKYGHSAGDRAIMNVSETILLSLRQRDLVMRVGGDEFVIVVEEYSGKRSTAYGLAKRLLKDISENKGKYSATVSMGVHVTKVKTFSQYMTKEEQLRKSWEQALKQADKALYTSKEAGGNKISTSAEYAKYY